MAIDYNDYKTLDSKASKAQVFMPSNRLTQNIGLSETYHVSVL